VLVDAEGRLRGVYDGTQPFEIDHLIEDARTLSRDVAPHFPLRQGFSLASRARPTS